MSRYPRTAITRRTAIYALATLALGSTLARAQSADPTADLVAACRAGDLEAVAAALADGADPNADAGLPPLHIAATRGDLEIATALLDTGADPDILNSRSRTPLVSALSRGRLKMMHLLIARGADVDIPEGSPGRSPLQLVIDEAPSLDAMIILLDAGADIDRPDDRGETALASAAFMNRPDATRLLIDRGARLDVVNNDGISPLDWATQQSNTEVIAILEDAMGN